MRIGLVCGVAAICAGCINSRVDWDDSSEVPAKELGGVYRLELIPETNSFERALNEAVAKELGNVAKAKGIRITANDDDENALPVTVEVHANEGKNSLGAFGAVNNVLSYCTLGIWPYVTSQDTSYGVSLCMLSPQVNGKIAPQEIARREVVIGERKWSSFLLPFAAIPCPGWGDWRNTMSTDSDDGSFLVYRNQTIAGDVAQMMGRDVHRENVEAYQKKRAAMLERRKKAVAVVQGKLSRRGTPARADQGEGDWRPIILIDEKDITGGNPAARAVVMGKIEEAIQQSGQFRILSKHSVSRDMKERELFAKLTGVDGGVGSTLGMPAYRLSVQINAFGTTVVGSTKKDYHKHKSDKRRRLYQEKIARTAFAVKISDIETKDEVFVKSYEDKESSGTKKVGQGDRQFNTGGEMFESDEAMLVPLVGRIASKVTEDIVKNQPFHLIDCTEDGVVTIDMPASVVKVGDPLAMFSRGKAVMSPRSGQKTRLEKQVATLRVVEAEGNYCKAVFVTIEDVEDDWDVFVRFKK